jgi:large repetitive protein
VTAGKTTEVDTLAGATCTAIETETGAATAVTYDPPSEDGDGSGPVDVSPDTGEITITNDYRAGGLQIVKKLDGPGAAVGKGPFVFDVSCDFNGQKGVFTDTVTLKRSGSGKTLKSDPITGLPVGAVCTVTETDNGGADSTPPPVTVTIPDVDDAGLAQVVVAGFVNPFSAAQIQITKKVDGTGASAASGKTFTVTVTCEVKNGSTTLTTLSTTVKIKGGQTVTVPGGNGKPALVPAGSHCFAKETDDGGADKSSVDHGSYDDAVVAKKGDKLATLTIKVTNTFDAEPPAPASTGTPVLGLLLFGLGLLLVGGGLVLVTRRRGSMV